MKKDKIIAVLILGFTAFFGYITMQLPASTMEGEPGPKFFPAILLALMALCALILFFLKPKEKQPEISEEEIKKYEDLGMEIEKEDDEEFEIGKAMILFGCFLLGIILMYFLGYIIGMTVGLTLMLCYVGWKVPKAVLISLIITCFVFGLFDILLHVPLPAGKLL
ncbi:MAG: tripartite tricarboxylate transporter TctB family protein [Peptococcaceae bacterium]|nr:tripartite tricarboxylate transporter TctB family protein [Peptococcaceae bacterium]